jgi:hypothetical protein
MDRRDVTLRDAMHEHLVENGFPPDGGLSQRWVTVRLGSIPVCIPNVPARKRALPCHDLNHLVTGYGHDALGEAEIGAFELGSGCRDYGAAWVLNWAALPLGMGRSPRRLFAAFVRGRRAGNLYGTDLEAVLDRPVSVVQSSLGLDRRAKGNLGDLLLFIGVVIVAPVVGAVPALASLLTSPVWIAGGAQRSPLRTVSTTGRS